MVRSDTICYIMPCHTMLRSDVLCVVIPYRCRAVLCIAWHCFVCRAPAMPCCNYTSALCMYVCMYVRILGGSWVLISGVISPLIWVISIVTLLITLLIIISTHEPPSRVGRQAKRAGRQAGRQRVRQSVPSIVSCAYYRGLNNYQYYFGGS